jgi:pimeloyl-ACP methyl ester carboxylesterase
VNETIVVDGRDAVIRRHHGHQPTTVLLHGAGANHHFFDELVRAMGGLDVVVPCLPGRCGSGARALDTVADHATWLRSVLRKLSLKRVVLVGHSLGGAIAIEYAVTGTEPPAPEIAGLVLVATGARLRVGKPILDAVAEAVGSGMPVDTAQLRYLPDTHPDVIARLEELEAKTPAASVMSDWKAADGFDRMQDLGRVLVPTLVIGGSSDALTPPKYAEYLRDHIPDARLELIDGGGHMMPVERTADVGRLVREFVTELA